MDKLTVVPKDEPNERTAGLYMLSGYAIRIEESLFRCCPAKRVALVDGGKDDGK